MEYNVTIILYEDRVANPAPGGLSSNTPAWMFPKILISWFSCVLSELFCVAYHSLRATVLCSLFDSFLFFIWLYLFSHTIYLSIANKIGSSHLFFLPSILNTSDVTFFKSAF